MGMLCKAVTAGSISAQSTRQKSRIQVAGLHEADRIGFPALVAAWENVNRTAPPVDDRHCSPIACRLL